MIGSRDPHLNGGAHTYILWRGESRTELSLSLSAQSHVNALGAEGWELIGTPETLLSQNNWVEKFWFKRVVGGE